jgi:hypothetical protein
MKRIGKKMREKEIHCCISTYIYAVQFAKQVILYSFGCGFEYKQTNMSNGRIVVIFQNHRVEEQWTTMTKT